MNNELGRTIANQQRSPLWALKWRHRSPHEYVLVRRQASLYYLPLLIILHAVSYMVFIPGEMRKQDDDDERSVAKDKIAHVYILTELDGRTWAT